MAQHPEIYMPERTVPEPHFFLKDWEYEKGIDTYSHEWFAEVAGEKARGEKSSSYLFGGRKVAERINRDLPDVRLIVMLRDPAERAWAHYRFTALNGLETLSFDEALEQEEKRNSEAIGQWATIRPYDYTGRSMYAHQLSAFCEIIPKERILVLKSEDFTESPDKGFQSVFQFLGVSTSFKPVPAPKFSSPNVIDPAVQAECRSVFGDRFGEVLREARANTTNLDSFAKTAIEKSTLEKLQGNMTYERQSMPVLAQNRLSLLFQKDLEKLGAFVDFSIDDWIQS